MGAEHTFLLYYCNSRLLNEEEYFNFIKKFMVFFFEQKKIKFLR
jgi:hypothetical protein